MTDVNDSRSKKASGGVTIIGIPYDEKSSHLKGPSEAPERIRRALNSPSTNLWTEMGLDLGEKGVLSDLGDVDCVSPHAPTSGIEAAISQVLESDRCPIVLGGDHSVTYPVVRALAKRINPFHLLLFDAHPDLYDEFDGDRYSHASPFARIMEERLIGRLVQVGVRSMTGHQRAQVDRFGVEVIEMKELAEHVDLQFDGPLYISFDMDALDPAFAPGVSHHEPGGLSTREVIHMIHGLDAEVVGGDIVEFNPRRDPLGITAAAAAKLLKELAWACMRSGSTE
jgi:arginase